MSKTSQDNAKVAKAMKGKAEAKASKNGSKPAAKEKAPKPEYVFKPLAKSFDGVAGKATMNGNLLKHVPLHAVKDGKTACGYSTQEVSKGLSTYELNWQAVPGGKVNCGRCLRNLNKPEKPKAEKKAKAPAKAKKAKKSDE